MVCGSVKNPTYADREDFDGKTGLTYNPTVLLGALEGPLYAYDPYPYVSKSQSNKIGRRGAGRFHIDSPSNVIAWCKEAPRAAAEYRSFAHLETAAA